MKTIKLGVLLLALLCIPGLALAYPVDANIFFNGSNALQVAWNATPGSIYRLESSTNIAGPWQDALPAPGTITATNSQIFQSVPVSTIAQFYRVTRLDTDGPEIYQVSPLDGGIAVGQTTLLQALLRDETGINTKTISLAIGTNAAVPLTDSRLTFTNGVLTYTPGTNEVLGALGSNVTIRVSAADTLGNLTTNFAWSFQIVLPTVPAANILFVNGTNALQLVSTNGNSFTFSYPGALTGLGNGTHLIDPDPVSGFTRTVVSFTNYPGSNSVVVLTRETKLAELLEQGSLSSDGFSEIVDGALARLVGLGIPLRHSFNLQQVLYQDANFKVEILPDSFIGFDATLNLAMNFEGKKLTRFESTLTGTLDFRLNAHAGAQGAIDRDGTIALISPIRKRFGTVIAYVPVWVEVVFELNAGYTAHLEGSADYTNGVQAVKEFQFGRRWDTAKGWSEISQNPPLGFSFLGPQWQVQGSGNLRVYLQPKVTLLVYSTAGVSGDLQPYAELAAQYQANPFALDLGLYAGLDSTMGLDLRVWDDSWADLPGKSFELIPRQLLWQRKLVSDPESVASLPQITAQPQPQSVPAGGMARFSVQASGSGPFTYRWQKNGLYLSEDNRITGTRGSTLSIANCTANDAGNYRVFVSNSGGAATSQSALLTVYSGAVPSGMALIPAGSFTMGDTLDGHAGSLPLHSVYVSAFYMDRYEVTKALWDEVYNWAVTRGYAFDFPDSAQGKAATHPAHSMTWYDAVKWCNARSEKEGRTPAYYTSAAQTTVYRAGEVNLDNVWVKWSSGYRLPTEAEWEKAARGGSSGRRFPWGDTDNITHSRANYYGYPASAGGYAYDLAPLGYHPTFSDGVTPYTSPVGYFAANGYGLYDMAGNVWEWCWDWSGSYGSASQTDPRGPATGSYRVHRGGSWGISALDCRAANRSILTPAYRIFNFGFRSVLPPGQP